MKSRRICRYGMMLVLFCLVALTPQKLYGAQAKDRNFNKHKSIQITEKQAYTKTGEYIWIKYRPQEDGYLTIQTANPSKEQTGAKGYLALFDSTKQQILSSKSIYYNADNTKNTYWHKIVFGLREKQDYYIRVRAQNAVTLTRSFKKVNDKSGLTPQQSYNLKKDKKKTGLLPSGTTNADWYQLTLPKTQKLKLYYEAKTSGKFRISIYMGSRRIAVKNIYYTLEPQKLVICKYQKSTGKTFGMDAGTYFVKVEKADTLSSGYYTLRWK